MCGVKCRRQSDQTDSRRRVRVVPIMKVRARETGGESGKHEARKLGGGLPPRDDRPAPCAHFQDRQRRVAAYS